MSHSNDPVDIAAFKDALSKLSLRDRRIARFYMAGDNMSEIGEKMGLSASGVRGIIKKMQGTFIDFTQQ